MPLYAGKYEICTFLQNMRNMLRSHDRYKPVFLVRAGESLCNLGKEYFHTHCYATFTLLLNKIRK